MALTGAVTLIGCPAAYLFQSPLNEITMGIAWKQCPQLGPFPRKHYCVPTFTILFAFIRGLVAPRALPAKSPHSGSAITFVRRTRVFSLARRRLFLRAELVLGWFVVRHKAASRRLRAEEAVDGWLESPSICDGLRKCLCRCGLRVAVATYLGEVNVGCCS